MAACGFRPVKKPSGACEEANITDIETFRGASWRRRCFDPEAEAQELQEQDPEGRGEAPPEAVAEASPSSASSQWATQEREAAPGSLILTTYYREVTGEHLIKESLTA